MVKNWLAMQEIWVGSLGLENPLEKGLATHPLQGSCQENSMDRGVWWVIVHGGHKESDTTEQLTLPLYTAG